MTGTQIQNITLFTAKNDGMLLSLALTKITLKSISLSITVNQLATVTLNNKTTHHTSLHPSSFSSEQQSSYMLCLLLDLNNSK